MGYINKEDTLQKCLLRTIEMNQVYFFKIK